MEFVKNPDYEKIIEQHPQIEEYITQKLSLDKAVTDPLTKLYNRNGMEEQIYNLLHFVSPDCKAVLMVVDLDNFKSVNDLYGHLLGEALLTDVAECMRQLFTMNALVGRIGGDEFLIYVYNLDETEPVLERVDKLIETIRSENSQYDISISVGLTITEHYQGYSTLFNQADVALYHAKSTGKNKRVVYEKGLIRLAPPERKEGNNIPDPTVSLGAKLGSNGFSMNNLLLDSAIDIVNKHMDAKSTIEQISKLIVTSFHVTRAYACCYVPDGSRVGLSYYYAANHDQNVPAGFPVSMQQHRLNFNQDNIFFCTDITTLSEPLRSEMERMQVKTLLQIFVFKDDEIIGLIGINNCYKKRLWVQSEIDLMHTLAKLLSPVVYEMQQEL